MRALHDLLRTDPRVRLGILMGTVPLAAAAELPAHELRTQLAKLEKAAKKGKVLAAASAMAAAAAAGLGTGAGVGGGAIAAVLLERAVDAADAADLDALKEQVRRMGGRGRGWAAEGRRWGREAGKQCWAGERGSVFQK